MRKLIVIGITGLLILSGCTDKKKLEEAQKQNDATRAELIEAVSDRDQLLSLVNEISAGMDQIKQLENILSVSGKNETPGQRERIQSDIAAIQQTLQQRREKLADLEKKLSASSVANSNLKNTIASLRSQIDSQANEIASLRSNLNEAAGKIGQLDAAVDSLHTTVSNVTAERDSTEQQNTIITNELNQCFYAIGTKSELKENKIIETGFLRKTKLMKGDFDHSFFTTADKRTLTTIDLNSDKAEVLTNQPAGSYVITEANGHKVLRITNPAAFWSLSNYLVIKID
ncbi:MAG: hypothetical protein OSJ37_09745 [Muribaculaceae bacterium]|jgi:chromosome segregation ATPase|nr:hypothetical protein [Muribaculaceae bacterium]